MKIRIITFHTPKNYGAVLQAFSLMSYLKKGNEDVKIIDYNTPHLRSRYRVIPRVKTLKGIIKTILLSPTYVQKKKKFNKFNIFINTKLDLTKRFETTLALYQEKWDADVFITGSDQVFNPGRIEEERKAFFLDFVPHNVRRLSYAGSFGVKEISEDRKKEIKTYLEKFDEISVRELSGQKLVKNITGREVEVVLDPVFLNSVDFWRKQEIEYRKHYKNYIFYYRLMHNKESDALAEKIAESRGLPLVVITEDECRMHTKAVLRDVGPGEFLYFIDHADFIVTDSFHGVAFSLIFQKQFIFSDENKLLNDRGLALLDIVGIREIAYSKTYDFSNKINYEQVNEKINIAIKASKSYLKKAIII